MAGVTTPITSNSSSSTKNASSGATDAINNLDLGTFLNLMIKELQNQDPLNPMDNKDMLAQLSQIREVGATDKLTSTLDSVLLGQNISSATNLIGADVSALSDDGESITGVVDRISIDKGSPKLHVNGEVGLGGAADKGNIAAGTYSYRVTWKDSTGALVGLDMSGDQAIKTTGTQGVDASIKISNLPESTGPKQVYRTDGNGSEPYQLVGTITDGSKASFTDNLSDADRNGTQLLESFSRVTAGQRSYDVTLSNVSAVRPPS